MYFTMDEAASRMKISQEALEEQLRRNGLRPEQGMVTGEQLVKLQQVLKQEHCTVEQKAAQMLERLTEHYAMLIDTNELLDEHFPAFMLHLIPCLQQHGKTLIVPGSVIRELRKLHRCRVDLRDQIGPICNQLLALQKEGLIQIYEEKGEKFVDKKILETVIHYMDLQNLVVITKDRKLSMDILSQKQIGSIERKKDVLVERINRYGYLSQFRPDTASSESCTGNSRAGLESLPGSTPTPKAAAKPKTEAQPKPRPGSIPKPSAATLISDAHVVLNSGRLPAVGDRVFGAHGEQWVLEREIKSGGEGTIYDLKDGTVAKIYRKEKLTEHLGEKLRLMTQTRIPHIGICWPLELVWDQNGQLVGYRMKKAEGVELSSILMNQASFLRHFPQWTRKETVRLCRTILRMIGILHRHGILLGDINLHNILVESPDRVWFVDCDSYQIGGYPCPVGTVYFTAPEIQGKPYESFLRTEGNENFAVASLLFMIMVPGMRPYTQRTEADAAELIREMNFPYSCGEHHSKGLPTGNCCYIWSHLPWFMKEAFYETFQKEGRHSTEQTRLSVRDWEYQFQRYEQLIKEGKLKDEESLKVFPGRRKVSDPKNLQVVAIRRCIDCGRTFEVTAGEQKYWMENGGRMAKRCPKCREIRRLRQCGVFDDEMFDEEE